MSLSKFLLGVAAVGALLVASLPAQAATVVPAPGSLAKLRADFARVRPEVQVAGTPARPGVVVGFATSMQKVLPRHGVPALTISRQAEVRLAQDERESLQVVVLPCTSDLKDVRVRAEDLRSAWGARFAASNVDASVVGYVKTKEVPPYGADYVGWWPDPILSFMKSTDIAKGTAQAFWVRVHAPKDQTPGLYRGKLEVEIDGAPAYDFGFAVRVFAFRVPAASPLPLAITFSPMFYKPKPGGGGYQEGPYTDKSWAKHKAEWADFLADYYITYDSLYQYAGWSPDFPILERLHREGRLGRFNLGYYSTCGASASQIAAWRKANIDVIRPRYEEAKRLGLLAHAYIYGCDENPPSAFPSVERAAALLKKAFPGVTILTTTRDESFGANSQIKSMDAFCPLTPSYNAALAARARADGKQVWWYICCGPGRPFANMFIEYPPIDARLLMGAMTAKYRPDGFLYYQISIWNSPPITSGPFTDWNPRSFQTYHGDGSWTCVGPGGMPLPTIRLENFRDGLEDYAYVRILQATIAKVEASPSLRAKRAAWLKRSKTLLQPPSDVVQDLMHYTQNPAALYRYRDRLASAIEAAGVKPARLGH